MPTPSIFTVRTVRTVRMFIIGILGWMAMATWALTATTMALTTSANPVVVGQSTTLTATLSSSAATGTVTFKDGTTALGTGTISGGVATLSRSFTTAADHSLTAVYAGDATYATSTSGALSQTVSKAPVPVNLSSSVNPVFLNQAVSLTATMIPSTITGNVTFKDGAATLGTVAISSGVATYATSFSTTGLHSLTAVYGGDANYLAGTSMSLSQSVAQATSTTTLATSFNPTFIGQNTTLTATVSPVAATGTVTFKDGSTTLGTGAISAGVATYAASFGAIGTRSLSAVYAGDTNYNASTSALLSQNVNGAPPALPSPPVSPAPVVTYEYDAQGNPTKTIQAPGVTGFGFATQSTYDPLSRPKNTTDAKSGVTQFAYNGREDLTQVTDPRSLVTQYLRNGLGDATSVVSPDTGTATQTYDAAGNMKTRTDSRGVAATYSYDALNRLTAVVYSQSGQTNLSYGWAYDESSSTYGAGRLTSTSHSAGTTRYSYDAQGRVISDTQAVNAATGANTATINKVVNYTYDAAGNVTSILYPSGRKLTVTYTSGKPSALALGKDAATTPVNLISQIQFSPFGGPQSWLWQMASSTWAHARILDTTGRLVRYPLGRFMRDVTYDAADRITAYTHYEIATGTATTAATALNQSFGYDELGRVTSVSAGMSSWSIGYDANGNRTSVTLNATASVYTTAATSNRLASMTNPARSFGYDAAGNTTSDSTSYTSTYNLSGRLATLTKSGATSTYAYDGMGRRVRKFISAGTGAGAGTTVLFVYDQAGHLLGEYNGAGTTLREYVWLGDTPVAEFMPDTVATNPPLVYYIHADHLDTPRVVVDQNNAIRWRWMAEPFGTTAPETNPQGIGAFTQNLRFPGQYADNESGLNYNWNRDYDATTGRYVQSDPIGLAGGINTYLYANANPLTFVDPMGLLSFSDVAQTVSDATGGCSDNSFSDDVINNFVNVQDSTSLLKTGASLALGGAFAKQYGGLTFMGAAWGLYKESRSGFAVTGIGSRTFAQAAATAGATWAANGVLIKGSYDAGVLAGSILRTGINRAASSAACTCQR